MVEKDMLKRISISSAHHDIMALQKTTQTHTHTHHTVPPKIKKKHNNIMLCMYTMMYDVYQFSEVFVLQNTKFAAANYVTGRKHMQYIPGSSKWFPLCPEKIRTQSLNISKAASTKEERSFWMNMHIHSWARENDMINSSPAIRNLDPAHLFFN
jgi:hypothetical protein